MVVGLELRFKVRPSSDRKRPSREMLDSDMMMKEVDNISRMIVERQR
jgi:hypothetical protein